MSYKSSFSNSGSCRQNSVHEKLHSTPSEEKIKFAGDESKDRLYEPKQNKKMVRVLTVVIYIFSVSLAAIMLSLYYVFFWNPKGLHYVSPKLEGASRESVGLRADNVTTTNRNPTAIPRCLENHDRNNDRVEETSVLPFQSEDPFTDTYTTENDSMIFTPSNDNSTDSLLLLTTVEQTTSKDIEDKRKPGLLLSKIGIQTIEDEKQPNNT